MAKITISIEDSPVGGVKVVSTPSFEQMAQMINAGDPGTSAHGYALLALRAIREESKKNQPASILIPRIGKQ